jgi:DNA-binding SARP family transcriptional activator/uncharacterized protein HemY
VAVQFAILGPVEVTAGGQRLSIGGQRARAVLARLIVAANHVVGAAAMAGELWPNLEPGRAAAVLQVRVAELRRVFRQAGAADCLVARAGGYVLTAGLEEVDAARFDQLARRGRALLATGDAAGAAGCLEEALGLWRGSPLADVGDLAWAQAEATRLGEARLAAVECHLQARLSCGASGELIAELEALTAGHRLRERLWALQMLALYRSGRQADALAAYQQLRAILVEELGIEPSSELRELHQRILTQDPALAAPAPALVPGPAQGRLREAETLAAADDASAALVALATGGPSPAVLVPHELPADVGGFIGRAVELAELDFQLPVAGPESGAAPEPVMISAVAGTAGVGKTALAVRWAHRVAGQFPDGQLYVNLRGYDPGQPMRAGEALAGFMRALGVADADIPLQEAERAARYRSLLSGRRVLVVLDNAATEDQVRPLLPGTSTAMALVTSRDSLAGLVAVDGARRLDLDLLPSGEAVALLGTLIGARAAADPAAAEALARLCAQLPLALRVAAELAAARPEAPLADLVTELASEGDRLELLGGGGDPRAAVASVFSWSYRHLPAGAGRMFRLLGLHPAQHWDLYAAAAVTAAASLAEARRAVRDLARAHLIQPTGSGRYQMHDLLRAYAAGLADSHDSGQARQAALTRLFDYYLATCAAATDCLSPVDRTWRPDPPPTATPAPQLNDPGAAQAWLDAELPTLVRVAEYTAGHGWPGHTGHLSATLHAYVNGTGHFIEGIIIARHALDAARGSGDRAAQAAALRRLGNYHCHQGDLQQGTDCLEQAMALARDLGDRLGQAHTDFHLAVAQLFQGRYTHSARSFRQTLALFRELGDRPGESEALSGLGQSYLWQGRYQQAASQLRQGLAVARQARHRHGEAEALCNLGEACWWLGQYPQATGYAQEALTTSRQIGYRVGEADALITLGRVRRRQGQHDEALSCQRQALALYQEFGDRHFQAEALTGTGETLLAAGQHTQAGDCFAAALALASQAGSQREQARALSGLGEVCHGQGLSDQAAGHYQQALALYQHIGDRGGQTEALNGTGETLLATGQPTQAHDCYTAALTLASRTGDRYQQARAHRGLAAACNATGQQGQGQQHWQRALDIYTDLGVPEAEQMRTSSADFRAVKLTAGPSL